MVAIRPDRVYRNPASDLRFAASVTAALLDADEPGALERTLRTSYPLAVVRASGLSGSAIVWYIYRDGTWIDDGA